MSRKPGSVRLPLFFLAALLLPADLTAAGEETVTVWVDDAQTKKVIVPCLDVDAIAADSNLKLYIDLWDGFIGFSVGWSKKRGIEYDEKARVLIEKLEELCRDFNDGKLSLETYRRRLRSICAAEEEARQYRYEAGLNIRLQALSALVDMDRAFGIPPGDLTAMKSAAEEALSRFLTEVESVPGEADLSDRSSESGGRPTSAAEALAREQRRSRDAAVASLARFEESVDRAGRELQPAAERIRIWKERIRTTRIVVPRLEYENLLEDVEASLKIQPRFSIFSAGPQVNWTLSSAADYNQATQVLVLKYKQLCLEYNADLVSQEEYTERLQDLYEAEDRARDARGKVLDLMREQTRKSLDRMDEELGKGGQGAASARSDGLEKLAGELAGRWDLKKKKQPSVLDRMSREHREEMARTSVTTFQAGVKRIEIERRDDTIEVYLTDAKKKRTIVARLDPELLAQNVSTRVALHLYFFSFGPEIAWARKKGMDYESASQLIIKYRQLCVEFNSGLVSLESFDRRRKAIDAAIERAAAVRAEFLAMARKMAENAEREMERQLEMRSRQPDGK